MSIDFTPARWERIKADSRRWWAGELQRPLIQFCLSCRDPGRAEPSLPAYGFAARYGPEVSAGQIVDRWEYDLEGVHFLGDAFPAKWVNFGAGVAAAFMGCRLNADENTVWFYPPQPEPELADIRLKYDPENYWLKRIADVMRAAQARFDGRVQIGMTDIGGALDILASFRPSEKLLLDLVDDPERVQRLTWETHELWWRYYDYFDRILRLKNPGFTAWASIFSLEPYYMFQCDFCYMLGPKMFETFVKPELAACFRRIPHAFYHLDGPGELPHLDSLLEIKELKGIQWIPGAGQPDCAHWPEVFRKIRKAGKLIQVFGDMQVLDAMADQLGSAEGICLIAQMQHTPARAKEVERFLVKYGA